MRILLVQPSTNDMVIAGDEAYIHEPLSLEYVGAVIPENHEVKLIDTRLEKNFEEVLETFNPQIVGLTSYLVHVNSVKKLCSHIKNFKKEIVTIVGGYQATICPESFDDPNIDILMIGQGLIAFKEVVEAVEKGIGFSDIKGITYRVDGKMTFTESAEYLSYDLFPFPKRELTAHLRHLYFNDGARPLASILTSKGCPFRCKFCTPWRQTGGKYLPRDAKKIVEELLTIKEPYVDMADDESFIDLNRMYELADLIKEAGIQKKYYMYIRSDTVIRNPDLLRKWKDIGLTWVFIGFESHREKDLKNFNKQNSLSTNEEAVKILKEIGIQIDGSFIVNQDFEEQDFDDLVDYVKKLEIERVYFPVLTPLPGTDLYKEVKDDIISHNYELYDFVHTVLPTKLPLEKFYREYAHMFLKISRDIVKTMTPEEKIKQKKMYDKIRNAHLKYQHVV